MVGHCTVQPPVEGLVCIHAILYGVSLVRQRQRICGVEGFVREEHGDPCPFRQRFRRFGAGHRVLGAFVPLDLARRPPLGEKADLDVRGIQAMVEGGQWRERDHGDERSVRNVVVEPVFVRIDVVQVHRNPCARVRGNAGEFCKRRRQGRVSGDNVHVGDAGLAQGFPEQVRAGARCSFSASLASYSVGAWQEVA